MYFQKVGIFFLCVCGGGGGGGPNLAENITTDNLCTYCHL